MTILSLAIDATQARRGAQEAAQAIDQVGKAAENTGRAVDNAAKQVGTSLDAQANKTRQFAKTVEAVGEATQIGQRVRLLGEEVRNLGSGMSSAASIAQTLSGTLIDIAQISGKVEGGFSGFIGLLRANPLLVAATVIGGIATAMSLFGGETKDANEELQRQIQLQKELAQTGRDLALQIQKNQDLRQIGFQIDEKEQTFLRARRIAEAASTMAGGGMRTAAEIQALTGETFEQTQQRLRRYRGLASARDGRQDVVEGFGVVGAVSADIARDLLLEVARAIREEGAKIATTAPSQEQGPGFSGILNARQIAELQRLSRDQSQGFSGILNARQIALLAQQQQAVSQRPEGPGFSMLLSPQQIAEVARRQQAQAQQQGQLGEGFNFKLTEVAIQQAEKRVAEFNERMRELKALGQDVGTAIGSAFFSIVNGAANARQALAALLQQFIAIAQQRAIQGIANSIGNAFAASAPQAAANTPGAASTGVSLRANP